MHNLVNSFLPTEIKDLKKRGWEQLDIIIVTGDAYIDHPAFGAAILGRWLEKNGFKVGIISQPDWRSKGDFAKLGRPRLFFGVTSGNVDSMVSHYTAQRKNRHEDAYSPGGKTGYRPDRAVIVYTQRLKEIFKDVPIVIGGIEASLRRIPHYDFYSDKIRNSVLFDSKADLLVYGMAERQILEIAEELRQGKRIAELQDIKGTVVKVEKVDFNGGIFFPEFEFKEEKKDFVDMTKIFQNYHRTSIIYQKFRHIYLKHNPPAEPFTTKEIDLIYSCCFQRLPHPTYGNIAIPAFEQIKLSVNSHRGCFGGCHFCAINLHQGRSIQSRSITSIENEVNLIKKKDYFKGTITDVGGPSANMYALRCLGNYDGCKRSSCLVPEICKNLKLDYSQQLKLLKGILDIPGVKNVFIASGIRFDLALKNDNYIDIITDKHISGYLKIAPEHKSANAIKMMNKAEFYLYEEFVKKYFEKCKKYNKNQFIVPYIMVGHPGTKVTDTIELAVYLKKKKLKIEQVQEFTPTPMTISTFMHYTKKDYHSLKDIYVPGLREIRLRKCLIQWFKPENKKYIIELLKKAKRKDLIDFFLK